MAWPSARPGRTPPRRTDSTRPDPTVRASRIRRARVDRVMRASTHPIAGPCGTVHGGPYDPPMRETPVSAREGEALVWTDGACSGNPGPGGWAAVVVPPGGGEPVELSGGEPATTNNRMELTAALEGLRSLPGGGLACVVTDSQLMLNSMTTWLA